MKPFRKSRLPYHLVLGLMLSQLLAGCGGTSPTVTYYGLASLDPDVVVAKDSVEHDIALGVGPVLIPDYLKNSRMALRRGHNRYHFDEYHRWAGMLDKDFTAVLANNLGVLLGTDKVAVFPWINYFHPDYQLVVEVLQFDGDLNGDAVLRVRWMVSDAQGKQLLLSGTSEKRQALLQPSYDALVDAESRILEDLCRDLAGSLRALAIPERR